ncbi:ribonuclease HII [Staphylococcus argensis]|uniref:Ribonuclease HII n=1 Tax=Staphylococcus argensis TaxID=1607738 RepID=A0A2K4FEP5_9STAP|nr:ribonuclease HII [Staphylococcus argensis]MCY6990301.1 ribonuclease HII [Staphylococcus argensis]POA09819.1 ribonuclease HII [Staphylococcus argensis]
MTRTIKEVREEITQITSLEELERSEWHADERKGVQQALKRQHKQIAKAIEEVERYQYMTFYENNILEKEPQAVICGVDEVGRGPLAGPVVTCAVVLNDQHHYVGINDSKQLNAKKRAEFEAALKEGVADYAFGIATVEEIDKYNIYQATQIAMVRAVEQLKTRPTHMLVDAMKLPLDIPQQSLVKGDSKSVSIAAASILAKEYRDRYMRELDEQYPGYEFSKNVGYGTKAHIEGLNQLGVTPVHRKSFEPIKSMMTSL